jgi:hypothetical protein
LKVIATSVQILCDIYKNNDTIKFGLIDFTQEPAL